MSVNKIKFGFLISALLLLCGCSLKKNTTFTRQYRAFTTRYNVYFNASEAYNESLTNFEQSYEDDYSQNLFLHPVSSLADKEPVANGGFDRAIEKSQKAIKLRSIPKRPAKNARKANDPRYKQYLKRTEYNPFLHNAWVLMGKSQFYKGDFLGANATFLYITRHFSWLPETVTESQLWMVRCYTEMGWVYEAENVLSRIDENKIPANQSDFFATTYAAYLLKKGESARAIPYLEKAVAAQKNKAQRIRMKFLLAQIYAENNDPTKAYNTFGSVIRMNPAYRTLFNASIKQTEVMPRGNSAKIEKKLNRMLRDPRNKEYIDQIYYAKGNLFLQRGDTIKAIAAYEQAVSKSTRNGMDKAVAALKLGDLTFQREAYISAQPAYAAAISILPEKHSEYARISRLSGVLDKLMVHAETVHMQDSLLTLAEMPEADRMKAIQRIIDEVIRQEKESEREARREEFEKNKGNFEDPFAGASGVIAPPTTNTGDNSWYFYNKTAVSAGKNDFQRRWGSRKPEDNWRRRNKTEVLAPFDNAVTESDPTDAKSEEEANPQAGSDGGETAQQQLVDSKNPEFYLRQLPITPADKNNAHRLIQEGLFNMGLIINRELENLPLAIKTLEKLDTRYPENEHQLDSYYEIYLMYMRLNDIASADVYKNKILTRFPASSYGMALSDPDYIRNLKEMDSRQGELYEETYREYLAGNTEAVHRNYAFVKEKWPLAKLMPQFLFLHSLSFVAEKNTTAFRENLEQLTALYGESSVAPLAAQMVRGLADGKELITDGTTAKGMIWKTRLSVKDGDGKEMQEAPRFEITEAAPHLLVLAFPTDSLNVNQLLFDVAKYNFTNFLVKDFDLEVITFQELSMLVVKGFDNFEELSRYRLIMALPSGLKLPEQVTPVMISDTNFRLLLEGRSFAEYFSFLEEKSIAKTESENPKIVIE